jgi:hypothetical protein
MGYDDEDSFLEVKVHMACIRMGMGCLNGKDFGNTTERLERVTFLFGLGWSKGQGFKTGRAQLNGYIERLLF